MHPREMITRSTPTYQFPTSKARFGFWELGVGGWELFHCPGSTDVTNARVNVMSTLSPGLTRSSNDLSSILRVTVRPSSVVTVTDGTDGSTDFTVTVRLSCVASVAAGSALLARLRAASELSPSPCCPGLRT